MTTTSDRLLLSPGAERRRATSRVRTRLGASVTMLVVAVVIVGLTWWSLVVFHRSLSVSSASSTLWAMALIVIGAAAASLVVLGVLAVTRSLQAGRLARDGHAIEARIAAENAKDWCWYVGGLGLTALFVAFMAYFLAANDGAIRVTFLNGHFVGLSWSAIRKGFAVNVKLFVVAEILVLIWGLLVAVARLFPGKAGSPVRFIAVSYTDLFRGLPAVVVIFLVVLGLPLANLPGLTWLSERVADIPGLASVFGSNPRDAKLFILSTFALVLVYGAYVAEVYRAGLESIHWSQTAAARSLGLSYGQTMRHVVVPQAVRRIIPPLLNDFIGLQKDTALISFVGVLEVFNRTRIIANNRFNLSPIVGAGLAFIVITIPQALATDWLIRRDQMRTQGGRS